MSPNRVGARPDGGKCGGVAPPKRTKRPGKNPTSSRPPPLLSKETIQVRWKGPGT